MAAAVVRVALALGRLSARGAVSVCAACARRPRSWIASFWTDFGIGAKLALLVEGAVVWALPVAWAFVAVAAGTGAVEVEVATSNGTVPASGASGPTPSVDRDSVAAGGSINDGFGKFPLGACSTTGSSVPELEFADGSFLAVELGSAEPCCPAPPPFSRSSNSVRLSKTFLNAVVFEAGESCESGDGAGRSTGTWRAADAGEETITAALMQVRDHNGGRRLSAR